MESPTQIFLLIAVSGETKPIGGEGRVDRYDDRILVDSFSFSMQAEENTVRKNDGQASAHIKRPMPAVTVSRPFDTASKALSRLLKNRTKFDEARLTVDQHMTWGQGAAREQNAIIVFHLLNGHVTSQTINAKEADKGASISETIELQFKNVAIEYYVLNRGYRDQALRNYRESPVLQFETQFDEYEE
jgi:type VI protein secretion system component Hcp